MALRALVLGKKIEQIREKLNEERAKDEKFITREAELEAALEEATKEDASEEEVKIVEEEVEAFEESKKEHDEEVSKLEAALEEAETELEEERSKNPTKGKSEKNKRRDYKEDVIEMRKGFFAGMTPETRERFMSQGDTKDFLERVRAFAKEKRSVTGAELTIPDNVLELLRDNMNRYSKMVAVITPKPVKGTARQTIAGTVPEGIWVEAIDALGELNISFNQIEMDGYKVGGYIAIPNSTLEDSDINLASEIL